jgi:hypothetical protein
MSLFFGYYGSTQHLIQFYIHSCMLNFVKLLFESFTLFYFVLNSIKKKQANNKNKSSLLNFLVISDTTHTKFTI